MNLLARIDRYLRCTGTPPSRFGREAANDPRLVHDLRLGRELRPETVERLEAFLTIAETAH